MSRSCILSKDEKRFLELYDGMSVLCAKNGWGDPHSYARGKEINASIRLGHSVSPTLSGADAYDADGLPVEYKSTIAKNCKGTYTGISKQSTWDEQVKHLQEEKIGKYHEHYYNRFCRYGGLLESWKMASDKVLALLLPKVKKSFDNSSTQADPRLRGDISWTEIKKYGTQVI